MAEKNASNLDVKDGEPIYTSVLTKHLSTRSPTVSPEVPLTIVDIGTGTGRVLINLANDAKRNGLDLSNVHFIGVDNEKAMLERAEKAQEKLPSMARVGKIVWVLGEAATVASAPALQNYIGGIDLLLFAAGSISHLTGAHEPQRFFAQVAKLLRPGSGRAYIPIMNGVISKRSITQEPVFERTWRKLQEAEGFPSKAFPNIIYKKYPVDESKVEGCIKTDYHNFHVIRQLESGEEEVIQKDRVEFSLRVWNEPEFLEWAKDAGLEFEDTFHGLRDTSYVFKV
ncbi:hypothetical protein ACJ72_04892 [Emergomyces africanus]|uniref:Methyltransferase domain-containing protein n=1 Tax=Emergomyces africanus TaxID=1955775 RepID=A0A1B7NVK0_9EURO|nr:hypothetical protein ACJ72_04892 [Emergomyces africanus]